MQVSMNHALDIIDNDGWLHMYPEGKVNYVTVPSKFMIPLKVLM